MTLERHKSKLIPDVDFSLEGRLFVTDNEGTFPIRGGSKAREKLPGPEGFTKPEEDFNDVKSFRSFDPKRDRDKKRKYKPNEPSKFGQEVANLPNATWGSGASKSLQRRLRKKKRQKELDYYNTRDLHGSQADGRFGTYDGAKSNWSSIAGKKKKKKRNEFTPGGSVGHNRSYRSLDLQAMRKYQKEKRKTDKRGSFQEIYGISNGRLPPAEGRYGKEQKKTIRHEKLPGLLFIITGSVIFLIGVVKLLTCWWHQYFYAIWAGLLILLQGVLGAYHRGDYLTEWLNGTYIVLGIASSVGTFAATFLSLYVLIPTIIRISMDQEPAEIAQNLNITNWHKSLAIEVSEDAMVFLNMSFDLSCLVLTLVSYFVVTATMACAGNHWDAVYTCTGQCDYRGTPRFFNPLEQISVGQATILFGSVVYNLQQSDENTYASSVWVGVVVVVAGILAFCSLRRIDSVIMAIISMIGELVAVIACSMATVFAILAISDESELASTVKDTNKDQWSLHIAAAVFDGFFLLFMLLNVVYCVGIAFRTVRKFFCYECWHGPPPLPDHTYA